MLLESPRQVRSNRGYYFTIFRAKMWNILIFEWILLLEVQTNSKNWVWKGKSVELSVCSYCQIFKFWFHCYKFRILFFCYLMSFIIFSLICLLFQIQILARS